MSLEAVEIVPYRDGPYLVRGPVVLRDQDGVEIDPRRRTVALCRCGKSKMRPFCDGTHQLVRFRAGSAPELGRRSADPALPSAAAAPAVPSAAAKAPVVPPAADLQPASAAPSAVPAERRLVLGARRAAAGSLAATGTLLTRIAARLEPSPGRR